MHIKKSVIAVIIGIEAVIIAAIIVFLFYISSDTVKVNRQLELAQRYLLEEDYERAIAAFEIVIEVDPKNVDAYLGLAEAYVSADKLEDAVRILEKAAARTDSDEILDLLAVHTEEMEQRKQAAQRADETASLAALETTDDAAGDTIETQIPETKITAMGFIVQEGELYYYDETGNLVTGWFDQDDKRYCARVDGRLYKSGVHEIDGVKYLFDQSGVCLGEMEEQKEQLPIEDTLHLVFASGAGAWGTELELGKDGTFSGSYHDSNMGETGEGYPGGTVYFCSFSGKFDEIRQVDEYTYSMILTKLTIEYPIGFEQIEDDILYIASEPYGIEDGKEFFFYTPEAPVNGLSEDFLSWSMAFGGPDRDENGTLSYYALYNKKMGYGFFGH